MHWVDTQTAFFGDAKLSNVHSARAAIRGRYVNCMSQVADSVIKYIMVLSVDSHGQARATKIYTLPEF